jgi:hypothetical protein
VSTKNQPLSRLLKYYGEIDPTRRDIRGQKCLSIDLRRLTGYGATLPDETQEYDVDHPFTLTVWGSEDNVAEVRMYVGTQEVRLVGQLTGRPNLREVTPGHLAAMVQDPAYSATLRAWVGA